MYELELPIGTLMLLQVALSALDIIDAALDLAGDHLVGPLCDSFTAVLERLGDSKDAVRQQALTIILKLMTIPGSSPQVACAIPVV